MEEKCNQLMRTNNDLFMQKYLHLIRFFFPVMDLDPKKKKVILDFQKQDKLLSERIKHVSEHLALRSVYMFDEPDLIRRFDNMASIQSKMAHWQEYSAKLALRDSPQVRSKTNPQIVENFIESYEKITELWEQMDSQYLVDSAYMLEK